MYGHCIQTFRAFEVQFKLCQTAGSWGKNPFIPPRLLCDDPRDQLRLPTPLPGSPVDQLRLPALKEKEELSLAFCHALSELAAHQLGMLAQIRWVMLTGK